MKFGNTSIENVVKINKSVKKYNFKNFVEDFKYGFLNSSEVLVSTPVELLINAQIRSPRVYSRFLGALFTLPVTKAVNNTFNIVLGNFIHLTGLFKIIENNTILTHFKHGYLLDKKNIEKMQLYFLMKYKFNMPMSVTVRNQIVSTLFGMITRLNLLNYTPKMVVATLEKLFSLKLTKDTKVIVKEIVQKEK